MLINELSFALPLLALRVHNKQTLTSLLVTFLVARSCLSQQTFYRNELPKKYCKTGRAVLICVLNRLRAIVDVIQIYENSNE